MYRVDRAADGPVFSDFDGRPIVAVISSFRHVAYFRAEAYHSALQNRKSRIAEMAVTI